jgi:glucokinase
MKALAIDFGGTHATCGLVEDRVLLAHETIDTDCAKSLKAVLPRIRDACRELMQRRGLSSRDVAGVAIGFAAIVDSRVNRILSTDGKYEDVRDIDLAEWFCENVGRPARIENDARMALLGES